MKGKSKKKAYHSQRNEALSTMSDESASKGARLKAGKMVKKIYGKLPEKRPGYSKDARMNADIQKSDAVGSALAYKKKDAAYSKKGKGRT